MFLKISFSWICFCLCSFEIVDMSLLRAAVDVFLYNHLSCVHKHHLKAYCGVEFLVVLCFVPFNLVLLYALIFNRVVASYNWGSVWSSQRDLSLTAIKQAVDFDKLCYLLYRCERCIVWTGLQLACFWTLYVMTTWIPCVAPVYMLLAFMIWVF